MKILKGIFAIISVLCIAFTAFFVYSAASGNITTLDKVEHGIAKIAGVTGAPGANSDSSTSTVGILADKFGLSTSQAGQVISMAGQLGVDTNDPAEVSSFVAKNIGNKDEIEDIVSMYQAGEITESQAKTMLKRIVNV